MDDFWEIAVGIALIALLWWGGSSVWNWAFSNSNSDYENSYSQPTSVFHSDDDCVEPENPYRYGSGHYAGWQWGEEGNYCSGNSNSFVEGCDEYQAAEERFEQCLQ
jgi:hypothetical protein